MTKINTQKIDVLFIGNLEHSDEFASFSRSRKKPQPHTDQIHFLKPVKVHLFRIIKPKRDIYKKYHSITQTERSIKNFEIFFRNIAEEGSRYSLLSKNGQENLLANLNDDILISSKEGVYTDILVVRGYFTKITVCVYGHILREQQIKEICPNWQEKHEAQMTEQPINDSSNQNVKQIVKSQLLDSILQSVKQGNIHLNLDYVETWYDIHHDDQINENQIRNFTNISQKLQQSHYALSEARNASNLVQFRSNLQQLYGDLSKIFRTKHLGLYYSSPFRLNQFITFVPTTLPVILLDCLNQSQSDQLRALEILRLLLQLQNMVRVFVSHKGLELLQRLYFHLISSDALSLIKVLVLEVFLVLAQYPYVAKIFTQKLIEDPKIYEMMESKKQKEPAKELTKQESKKEKSRQRSRNGTKERSESKFKSKKSKKKYRDDSEDSDRKKKKKRDKSRSRKKDEKRRRSRSSDDQKQKQKQKQQRQLQRQKEQKRLFLLRLKSQTEIEKPFQPTKLYTFYQLMISHLRRDMMYKQSMLTKMLVEQICHSVKKTPDLSQQVAIYSPLLRQTRHLFNPSRELVNNKTLKTFATYQPYLNSLQSEGMQDSGLDFICEVIKVKNPHLYNMDIKSHKLMNIINGKIINSQFDEQFILAISQLIISDKLPFLGVNRMVNALKSPQIKRNEAILMMLYEYIYKAMVQDEGNLTLLHIDQVGHAIVNMSQQQRQGFSRDMLITLKFMFNYAIVFDQCFSKQFILKTLADYFLKSFQYISIELSNGKYFDYQNIRIQPWFQNLKEIFNLGSFNELLPEQPLLVIDGILKVFVVLCKYNKNVWTSYYELKLSNGFAVLTDKMTKILQFFLSKNLQQEYASSQLQQKPQIINNYFSVLSKLLILILEKTKCEAAFNQLPQQDIFQQIEIFTNCLILFDECLAAYYDFEIKIQYCKPKIIKILETIIQIFSYLFEGIQLNPKNKNKQKKLKRVLDNIYIKHSKSIRSRPQMLILYGCLLQCNKDKVRQFMVSYFLTSYESRTKLLQRKDEVLIPINEKSVLENIFKINIFRSQQILKNSLVYLFKIFLEMNNYQTTLFIFNFVSEYLKQTIEQLKSEINREVKEKYKTITLNKLIFIIQFIEQIMTPSFKNVFIYYQMTNCLVKLFKDIVDHIIVIDQVSVPYQKVLLKLRNILLKVFIKLCNPSISLNTQSTTIGFDIMTVQNHQQVLKLTNLSLRLPDVVKQEANIKQQLQGCLQSIKLCLQATKTLSSQTIILYGQFVQNAYKPDSLVFVSLILQSKLENYEENLPQQYKPIYCQIYQNALFFLVSLTQLPNKGCYNCERRKSAIKYLIGQSIFFKLSDLPSNPYLVYLLNYFNSASIEIKLERQPEKLKELTQLFKIQKENMQKKPSTLTQIFNNFSNTVLEAIFEKQQIAKARYKCVSGEWIGGNINDLYKPLQAVDVKEIIKSMFKNIDFISEIYCPKYEMIKDRGEIIYNELLALYTKKQYSQRVKRIGTATIAFRQLPLEIKPLIIEQSIPKQSVFIAPPPISNSIQISTYQNPTPTPIYTPPPPPATTYPTYTPPTVSSYVPPPPPPQPQSQTQQVVPQNSQSYINRPVNPMQSQRGYDNQYYQHQQQQQYQQYQRQQQHQQQYQQHSHTHTQHHNGYYSTDHRQGIGANTHNYGGSYPYQATNPNLRYGSQYPSSGYPAMIPYQSQQPTYQTVSELVQKITRSNDPLQKSRFSQQLTNILGQYPHLKAELSKRLNEIKEGN